MSFLRGAAGTLLTKDVPSQPPRFFHRRSNCEPVVWPNIRRNAFNITGPISSSLAPHDTPSQRVLVDDSWNEEVWNQ